MRTWNRWITLLLLGLLALSATTTHLQAAGKDTKGEKIPLLVYTRHLEFAGSNIVDEAYKKRLEDKGFAVTIVTHEDRLSLDYLKQFAVVVVSGLPSLGEEFTVWGFKLRNVKNNMNLLHEYLAAGGGVVLQHAANGMGASFGESYNNFLEPYGAKLLVQQVRDDGVTKRDYAIGQINNRTTLLSGFKHSQLLYCIRVLRWDNAYSTVPVITDRSWEILARGLPSAGSHIALDNANVGKRLTDNHNLIAGRKVGKGYLIVSGIHSFYTLSMISHKEDHIGESATGIIDGISMYGERADQIKTDDKPRPSYLADAFDFLFQKVGENSLKNDLGKTQNIALPTQEPYPSSTPAIDWANQPMPPTWQHRVIPGGKWPNKTYDELPDPLVQGELNYYKVLIGARSRYSNGSGSVKDWRDAAIEAGYSALIFTEPLEAINEKEWNFLVRDCKENSDDTFVCMPGLAMTGIKGGKYLVLNARRYPDASWLTPDGTKLAAIRMLSLGWHGHLSVAARPNSSAIPPVYLKQCNALAVATYNAKGQLVDDGKWAYQWQIHSDSFPIPISVHELDNPAQVATAARAGMQQIAPAPTLDKAMYYFPFGHHHAFDCPPRYFVSGGPIIDGWSIYNKDYGKPEFNRMQHRVTIGVRSPDETPLKEIRLYDHFRLIRKWKTSEKEFRTTLDSGHDMQHEYMLEAVDAQGRTAITPGIRTVTRNYALRCTDRQNWLGSLVIYTGWTLNGLPGYNLSLENTREGSTNWGNYEGGQPAMVLDFPYFAQHVQVGDCLYKTKFLDATHSDIAGDGKGPAPVRPNEVVDGQVRYTLFGPQNQKDFDILLMETTIELKNEAQPTPDRALNPTLTSAYHQADNKLLILPGKAPQEVVDVNPKNKRKTWKKDIPANFELPKGTYFGGIVTLSEGLHANGQTIGFAPPAASTLSLPAGTAWTARYLLLKPKKFHWKSTKWKDESVDDKAEAFLTQAGFRGTPPYAFKLSQGTLASLEYIATFDAKNGGIAGRLENPKSEKLLYNIPLLLKGLNLRCASVLWRSDSEYLQPFAGFDGQGYVTFNADKSVEFYAGNVAVCDPALFVETIQWTKDTAQFRLHNPTNKDITTTFVTAAAVKGFKPLNTKVTIKAGTSIEVKSE